MKLQRSLILGVGFCLTAFCAMSIHVAMLDIFHVPYPAGYPTDGTMLYLAEVVMAFATLHFWQLAADKFKQRSIGLQALILFLLLAMLREQLLRKPFMGGLVTTAWTYSFVSNIEDLVPLFVLALLVVIGAAKLAGKWQMLAGAILSAATAFVVCGRVFAMLLNPVLQRLAYLDHDVVYTAPYGSYVNIPSYVTYGEPTMASFVVAALVWHRLSPRLTLRVVEFVLLVMCMDLQFFRPVVYAVDGPMSAGAALLSASQFWLEALSLALLTAGTWYLFARDPRTIPTR